MPCAYLPRLLFVLIVALPLVSACLGGGDEEDTDAEAVAATPTVAADPTATLSPTAEPTSTPEPEPSPTATSTSEPTATPRPQVRPQPTPTPIVIHTPTPEQDSSGGAPTPDDLLAILPQPDGLLPGLVTIAEGPQTVEDIALDADDAAARADQLVAWGFQQAAFREYELPQDQLTNPDSQLQAAISLAILFGSPESAVAEMESHRDEIVLAAPEITMNLVEIAPLGDNSSAASGSGETEEGQTLVIGAVWVTAGPLSLRFLAASGPQYDPIPDLVGLAQVTLDNLGFTGAPAEGAVLLQTDFSNWVTGPLESGEIFIADGTYHLLVTTGEGSFISAYSTDHEPFTDFSVSVDLRRVGGDPQADACVLARVDTISQQYDYALCIDGSGNIAALYEQFDHEGNYSSEPLLPVGSVTVAPPDEWTTLKIIARGEEFWFFVNGELIDTAQHTGPPGGAVGVIVNNFGESPAEFEFANLVVRGLE